MPEPRHIRFPGGRILDANRVESVVETSPGPRPRVRVTMQSGAYYQIEATVDEIADLLGQEVDHG